MHTDTQQIWPKGPSRYGKLITMRKAPDGTHFALETSFIGHYPNEYPKFRIIAAGKDFNAVMEKLNKFCSLKLGDVLSELKFRNRELMRTPEGIIENHTVDFVEDVRDARGPEYAYELANNILETQRELGEAYGNDMANDLLGDVVDAERRLGNNLPEDNG
jgi:hypothetical protein